MVSVTYSKLDGRHLLESWIPLLALAAHEPGRDWSAVCIGRAKRGNTPRLEGLGPPGGSDRACCGNWWRCTTPDAASRFRCRSRRPTPGRPPGIAATTRCSAASYRWKSSDRYPGEDKAPAHERAWGRGARLADLMQPLRPGEEYEGERQSARRLLRATVAADAARREGARTDGTLRPAGPAARRPLHHRAGGQRRARARRSRWPGW